MFAGTGCLPGRQIDISPRMHVYLSYLSRLYGKNIYRDVFHPVPAKRDPGSFNRDPGESGTIFIMYKHSVPLCRAGAQM